VFVGFFYSTDRRSRIISHRPPDIITCSNPTYIGTRDRRKLKTEKSTDIHRNHVDDERSGLDGLRHDAFRPDVWQPLRAAAAQASVHIQNAEGRA